MASCSPTCGALALTLGGSIQGGDKIPPQSVEGKIRWIYDYDQGKELNLHRDYGDSVSFVVHRDGKEQTLSMKLPSAPPREDGD